MKTKSKILCSVHGCNSTYKSNDISFHVFPKHGERRVPWINSLGEKTVVDRNTAWELALKMNKPPSQYMRVCSLHFSKSDFTLPGTQVIQGFRARLRGDAVPSVNLPSSAPEMTDHPRHRRKKSKSENVEFPYSYSLSKIGQDDIPKMFTEEEQAAMTLLVLKNAVWEPPVPREDGTEPLK